MKAKKYQKIKEFIQDGRDTKTIQKIALELLKGHPIIGIYENYKKEIKELKNKERL